MQFHDDISEAPQYLWAHPVRAHGFTFVQLPEVIPDLLFRAWD